MTEEIIIDGGRMAGITTLKNEIIRLEQENRELKEMLSKEPEVMQAFQISYSGLKRDNETLWGMIKDYKTALEEIREELCYGKTFYEGYFDNENLSRTDKVIKKINGVLNNEA